MIFAGLIGGPLPAQIDARGPEFQINSFTDTDALERPGGIAFAEDGGFVVVWNSEESPDNDNDASSIQARRFDASGAPLGPQFQVNTLTTGFQTSPTVVALEDDGFLVVWASDVSSGSDLSDSIQARRFDADGIPLGPDFQVNSYTTGMQWNPDSTVDAGGNLVIAWSSLGSPGSDQDGHAVLARRFDADVVALGPDFQVDSFTVGEQHAPSVARLATGAFVVAWASENGYDNYGIRVRRFAADGTPQGPDSLVTTVSLPIAAWPDVAYDESGFVVTWHDYERSTGTDHDRMSVQARVFDAAGTALGPQFQVNQTTPGYQWMTSVAKTSDGGFLVAWESYGSSGTDSDSESIQVRRFHGNREPIGGEFQVNTYTTSAQRYPVLQARGDEFLVAWTSLGSFGDDTIGWSTQARRLAIPFFADGFESGDTRGWSMTAP